MRSLGGVIGERWGVTDDEVARRFPCDDILPTASVQVWRGVSVEAPPERVWPWLCQVRLAPYSYDWLDNLGRRSPRELRGLGEPAPGESFSCVGGRFPIGRVLAVATNEHLTGEINGVVMSYLLVPRDGGTRLLLKIVMNDSWYAPLLAVGDWPMARRQLKNLKALAEGSNR
jgi:hypothetical protein